MPFTKWKCCKCNHIINASTRRQSCESCRHSMCVACGFLDYQTPAWGVGHNEQWNLYRRSISGPHYMESQLRSDQSSLSGNAQRRQPAAAVESGENLIGSNALDAPALQRGLEREKTSPGALHHLRSGSRIVSGEETTDIGQDGDKNVPDLIAKEIYAASIVARANGDTNCLVHIICDLRQYLEGQDELNTSLSDALTITGDSNSAFTTTCEQYIKLFWGTSGHNLLLTISDILTKATIPNSDIEMSEPITAVCSGLSLWFDSPSSNLWDPFMNSTHLRLKFEIGEEEKAIEVLKPLTWLIASFRQPKSGELMSSRVTIDRRGKDISIGLARLEPFAATDSSSCWQSLFKGFVLATGFEVRNPGFEGLDIPFDVMLHVTRMLYHAKLPELPHEVASEGHEIPSQTGDYIDSDDDSEAGAEALPRPPNGSFFGGVDSLLYPVSCERVGDGSQLGISQSSVKLPTEQSAETDVTSAHNDGADGLTSLQDAGTTEAVRSEQMIIKWHYEKHAQSLLPPPDICSRTLTIDQMRASVCILGFTPRTEIHLGTADRLESYKQMQETSARHENPNAQISLQNVAVSVPSVFGQSLLQATAQIQYPQNTGLGMSTAAAVYEDVLENCQKTPVVLFDTTEKQEIGWLVPLICVILDLVHLRISQGRFNRCEHADLQADGAEAANKVLNSEKTANFCLRHVNHSQNDTELVKDLVVKIWTEIRMRKIYDTMNPMRRRGSLSLGHDMLLGWDLLEVVNPLALQGARRRQFAVHEYKGGDLLAKTKPSWLKLSQDNLVTVFFCHGLGEIITQRCRECNRLSSIPRGKQNLVATLHALKDLFTREECCYHFKNGLVWKPKYEDCFWSCACEQRRFELPKIQELLRSKRDTNCNSNGRKRFQLNPSSVFTFGARITRILRFDSQLADFARR